jgi:hypothetical protein
MTNIRREYVIREKVDWLATRTTGNRLHPEEILNPSLFIATYRALCAVKSADAPFECFSQRFGRLGICVEVKMKDLLGDNPVGHWIDIITDYVAPYAIRLYQRRPATHKRIGDTLARQRIRSVISIAKRSLGELRE